MKVRASVKKICKDCKIGRRATLAPSNFAERVFIVAEELQ